MIVDQADSLHKSVTDSRSDKLESAAQKIAAHSVRFRSAWRYIAESAPPVYAWLAADERPDVGVEASEFALNQTNRFGVLHRAHNLQSVPNDPRIQKKTLDFRRGESGYPCRIEVVESIAIPFAL